MRFPLFSFSYEIDIDYTSCDIVEPSLMQYCDKRVVEAIRASLQIKSRARARARVVVMHDFAIRDFGNAVCIGIHKILEYINNAPMHARVHIRKGNSKK